MGRAQAAFLCDKEELTKAGFPRVLAVGAHEQPRQDDEQQGRQKCDELHKTGRILGVSERGLSSHQNTQQLLKKTPSTPPFPKAKQQSALSSPCSSIRTQSPPAGFAAGPDQPSISFRSQTALLTQSAALAGYWGCPQLQHLSSPLPASPSISCQQHPRSVSKTTGAADSEQPVIIIPISALGDFTLGHPRHGSHGVCSHLNSGTCPACSKCYPEALSFMFSGHLLQKIPPAICQLKNHSPSPHTCDRGSQPLWHPAVSWKSNTELVKLF